MTLFLMTLFRHPFISLYGRDLCTHEIFSEPALPPALY